MKIVLSESQYKRILREEEEEQKVLHIPSLKIFDDNWDMLQKFLELKGNPPYTISGNLDLYGLPVKSLGNLQSVGGYLDLRETPIKSLGNLQYVGGSLDLYKSPIKSLGNLTSVGGYLDLLNTSIESLGNLTSVGGYLDLRRTALSKMYTKEQIRKMVNVGGEIYL
jgi:hypothetical protein